MKRALLALLLVACAAAPAIERTPTTLRAATVLQPPALELSFHARRIFAGREPNAEHAEGSLLMVIEDENHHNRLDELDVGTMRVFRSLDFGTDDFAAFERRGDVLYVVTVHVSAKVGATHTLHRVDAASLKIVKSAKAAGAVSPLHTDHAFPPFVSVGSHGVRVVYRGSCPESFSEEEREGSCVLYETHRLDDLGVVKVHIVPLIRVYSDALVHAPDDYGELPPEPKPERPVPCKTHGSMFIDGLWVGEKYFELRSGCCDEPRGGFFQCKAPK